MNIAATTDTDTDLELAIKAEYDAMNLATDRPTAQRHWQAMVRLIQRRSPKRVAEMEQERGLR